MDDKCQPNNYSRVAKFLHWIMALLIIINYIMGLTVHNAKLFEFHEQIGLIILVLVVFRIVYAMRSTGPKPLAATSQGELIAAKTVKLLLYFLMVIIPLIGIVMVNAKAYHPLALLWLIPLPTIIAKQSHAITHCLVVWHIWLSHLMMLIVGGHALIALLHHYVIKDRLLARMLPSQVAR